MKTIDACTRDLVQSILESEEYLHYCSLRDKMKEDAALHRKLNAFRKHVYEVQSTQETLDMYSEQERLGKFSAEFRKDERIDACLQAELRVCRIFQKVVFQIADAMDLDLEDVADLAENR